MLRAYQLIKASRGKKNISTLPLANASADQDCTITPPNHSAALCSMNSQMQRTATRLNLGEKWASGPPNLVSTDRPKSLSLITRITVGSCWRDASRYLQRGAQWYAIGVCLRINKIQTLLKKSWFFFLNQKLMTSFKTESAKKIMLHKTFHEQK